MSKAIMGTLAALSAIHLPMPQFSQRVAFYPFMSSRPRLDKRRAKRRSKRKGR